MIDDNRAAGRKYNLKGRVWPDGRVWPNGRSLAKSVLDYIGCNAMRFEICIRKIENLKKC